MTYDQYKTIMEALDSMKTATMNLQDRRPLSPVGLYRERQVDAAMRACREAFNAGPGVVIVNRVAA